MTRCIPQLVAHRGYMQCYPENSWRGLEAALNAGACWLEFDVQMCRDGQFVLLHDDNFLRTAGVDQSVFTLDGRDIAISVHEPTRFDDTFAPTLPSRLDEVLERLRDFPQATAMIEIKQESIDRWGLDKVMAALSPILEAQPGNCCLISFNADALQWSKARSSLMTGWVLSRYDTAQHRTAEALQADILICNYRKIPPAEPLWPGPWQWMLYDITDPVTAFSWAERGAALIETADIGAMLAHEELRRRACRHTL